MNKRHKWQKRKSARLKNIRERERKKEEINIFKEIHNMLLFRKIIQFFDRSR